MRSGGRWITTSQNSASGLYSVIHLPGTNGILYSVSVFGEIGTYLPDFNTWLSYQAARLSPDRAIWASSEGISGRLVFPAPSSRAWTISSPWYQAAPMQDPDQHRGSAANDAWAVSQKRNHLAL